MRKILDRLSPRGLLLATLIASVLPFMLVELFPAQFYLVMDVPSYLVFHNITEFFSVMVSLSIFGVGWYAYDQSSDRHALFVSAAFLAIGLMDFMHTLSVFGMPAFYTPSSVDKGARFWILVRMFSALAFLGSAFVYAQSSRWWLSKTPLLVLALTVTGFAFAIVIFFPQYMPATFVPGVGLTSFKKDAEYLIIGLLLLATLAYWRRMSMTGDRQLVYYSAAFIVSIFSELVFVYYKSAFDTFNGLGHIYKIVAFYLIYKGIFTTSIKYPYVRLSEANAQLRIEIAERKQAEEALHESARYLRQLLNNLPAAVVVHGPDSAIRYGNPAAQQILCLNEAQLLGKTAFDPAWHFTREDGSVMPVEEYPANRVLAKRAPLQHYQVGIVRASGAEPMWAYVNAYPDLDEQGHLREVIVTFLDITELKQLQQQLKKYHAHLEDQVEQRTAQLAAANKELETFAYSVSHDLRVPLRAIDGFSLILLEDYHDKLDAEGQRVLNVVRDNAQKMGTLIDDILAFSRMGRK